MREEPTHWIHVAIIGSPIAATEPRAGKGDWKERLDEASGKGKWKNRMERAAALLSSSAAEKK
jgi:hypothetical protein